MKNLTAKQKETKTRKAEKLMNQALELLNQVKKDENGWGMATTTATHLENATGQVQHLTF